MKVSIIIPTYNEAEVLADCLESLGIQSFTDFEIIVVDDGSTDSTSQMLRSAERTLPSFSFFEQKHLGPGAARNLGAKHAKGEILVFVDADMTFENSFLENLVKPIQEGKTKGTFSKEEIVSNWNNVWSRCWNINENWEDKKRHPKNYPDHQPVFRAILKSEFDRVGGFNPGGYDDDWSLSKKLGYEADSCDQFYSPKALFFHKNPSSLNEIFNHAKWVGKRKYKLGMLGDFIALVRSSLPVSLCIGVYKSVISSTYQFLIFKIVYDFGIFVGILDFLINGKSSK